MMEKPQNCLKAVFRKAEEEGILQIIIIIIIIIGM
jgi:hypothetical protein